MEIHYRQILAARLLLQRSKIDIANAVRMFPSVLGMFEIGRRKLSPGRIEILSELYETAGAQFIDNGVQLRDKISRDESLISPEQCRAARGLLVLPMEHLAMHSGLSLDVIINLEKGRTPFRSTAEKLLTYFEAEGIRLLPGGARDLAATRYVAPARRSLK